MGFLESFSINLGGTSGSLGIDNNPIAFSSETKAKRIATIICYESVFGEYLNGFVRGGAEAVFVLTNDGWWGDTSGYLQHLRLSQIRAIETERSVSRSANTGISCFINRKGEKLQATEFGKKTVIRAKVNTNNELTYYSRSGNYIGRIALFLAILGILYTIVDRLKREKNRTATQKHS